MQIPEPDFPLSAPTPVQAHNVTIRSVGALPTNSMAEVLASDKEGRWFRFYLKRTARVVRLFYKGCGVTNGPGWLDGCVEHKTGIGNYVLEATHIGNDKLSEAEQTLVLTEVTLKG